MLTFFGMILGTIFFIIVMIVYGIMRLCGHNPDKSQDEKITKAIQADNKRENDIYAEFGDYHEYKEEHTSKYVDFSDKKIQSEMVEAATNYRKNGFGDEESANLARISSLLQNIADEEISAGEATDFIISQIKGFNIAAEDSIHIVDAVNQVANEYSLSSGDLIKNLGTVSAALSVGGNSFEEVLGLVNQVK